MPGWKIASGIEMVGAVTSLPSALQKIFFSVQADYYQPVVMRHTTEAARVLIVKGLALRTAHYWSDSSVAAPYLILCEPPSTDRQLPSLAA